MSRKRTTVSQLASEAGIEPDEALIALWDAGFASLTSLNDPLPRGDANRARRILGLATRRELSAPEYWQQQFGISRKGFDAALQSLGVSDPYEGGRLRKKAIHRLQSELRSSPKASEAAKPRAEDPGGRFTWEVIGHERQLSSLSVDDIKAIHAAMVVDFRNAAEPIEPPGVRSEHLLASAAMRPETAMGDTRKYPTVEMAAGALLHSIVHDHPFNNGNKRTAVVAMLVFLDENGMMLTCEEDGLFKLVLQVAQHSLVNGPRGELADRETLAIAKWITENVRWIEKGDRAITWRKLEQILTKYQCSVTRAGSNMTIKRAVARQVKFLPWLSNARSLTTQTHFSGNGREVPKGALSKLRKDLELDEDHGVDSQAFYNDAKISPSDFISRYRKTLTRLARL